MPVGSLESGDVAVMPNVPDQPVGGVEEGATDAVTRQYQWSSALQDRIPCKGFLRN